MNYANFEYDVKRVDNDTNGNPRYVIHFLAFVNDADSDSARITAQKTRAFNHLPGLFNTALYKSRSIGGKKYRGKDFGGGIVIQSYDIDGDLARIVEIQKS